ncbi:unnamed protein product [Effrenium voratum]|nr:unnamed protein product [Effrenium voratum]
MRIAHFRALTGAGNAGSAPVLYEVVLGSDAKCWAVRRRYRDFYEVHWALHEAGLCVPNLPPKEPLCQKVFGRDETRLRWRAERCQELHNYLERLLDIHPAPDVQSPAPLRRFLALDEERLEDSVDRALALTGGETKLEQDERWHMWPLLLVLGSLVLLAQWEFSAHEWSLLILTCLWGSQKFAELAVKAPGPPAPEQPDAGCGERECEAARERPLTLSKLQEVNLHFRQLGCSFSVGFLLLAAEGFAQVVRRMGAPLRLAALEVEKNHRKVEAHCRNPAGSFRSFLEAEKASGRHGPGPGLADDSGAMGSLWIRRTWEFVAKLFERHLQGLTMPQAAQEAYEQTLGRFHGRVLRGTFVLGMRMTSSPQALCRSLGVDEASLREQMEAFHKLVLPICEQMRTVSVELDLEDTRRV